MKLRNFIRLALPFIPVFLSILGTIGVIFLLQKYFVHHTQEMMDSILYVIIISSVLIAISILRYTLDQTSTYKIIGNSRRNEIKNLTKQIHFFRDIAAVLLESDLWAPGLKNYLEKEFAGLNFFDIKEFYRGRNKLALEYIEQNNKFGETESLYLEIKSLLLNDPAQSVVDGYKNPQYYSKRILKKWAEHHVGNGIYHYFGFKYINFREDLDVSRIQEEHQDIILDYAIQIENQRYQNMGFSEELLSKLGAHLSEEVIPSLLAATQASIRKIPQRINATIILFICLILFGIFLPMSSLIFQLPLFFAFTSIGAVAGVLTFLLLSIYPYVRNEINAQ